MHRSRLLYILVLVVLLLAAIFVVRWAQSNSQLATRPGTGIVIGTLDMSSQKDKPYNAQDLYLATLLYSDQPDRPPVLSFTYGTDPQTTSHDANGKFVFANVPPQTYALIVWTPAGGFPIQGPDGGFIKVVVEADKTTDLGSVALR